MAFDPAGFLATGRFLLAKAPGSEATFRTVCGRAYYAVYGTMRNQLCQAKGVSPGDLFGPAGRDGEVINALALGSAPFRSLVAQYRRLHIARVKSDYRYSAQVARREAERALDDADWVTSRLSGIRDREFRTLPLAPHRQP